MDKKSQSYVQLYSEKQVIKDWVGKILSMGGAQHEFEWLKKL